MECGFSKRQMGFQKVLDLMKPLYWKIFLLGKALFLIYKFETSWKIIMVAIAIKMSISSLVSSSIMY
jgi:hypothetical protein